MGSIVFDGRDTSDYGIISETVPNYEIAERSFDEIIVPGRSSPIYIDNGTFGTVEREYSLALVYPRPEDVYGTITSISSGMSLKKLYKYVGATTKYDSGTILKPNHYYERLGRHSDVAVFEMPMKAVDIGLAALIFGAWTGAPGSYKKLTDEYDGNSFYRLGRYAGSTAVADVLGQAARMKVKFVCQGKKFYDGYTIKMTTHASSYEINSSSAGGKNIRPITCPNIGHGIIKLKIPFTNFAGKTISFYDNNGTGVAAIVRIEIPSGQTGTLPVVIDSSRKYIYYEKGNGKQINLMPASTIVEWPTFGSSYYLRVSSNATGQLFDSLEVEPQWWTT